MSRISDEIERFILDNLGESREIDISRNELAEFFGCAPSQINYVLETRFTVERGFVKESHRGGGGFIRVSRIDIESDEAVAEIVMRQVGSELSFKRAIQILDNLCEAKIITSKERGLMMSGLSDDALSMPFMYKDRVRAQIFKNILAYLLNAKEGE